MYNPIDYLTWLVFFLVEFVYFIGTIIGTKIYKKNTHRHIIYNSSKKRITLYRMIIVFSLVALVLSLIPFIQLIRIYGVNIISNIGKIYSDSNYGIVNIGVSPITLINHIAIALAGYYFSKYRFKIVLIIPVLTSIILQLLSGSRGLLVVDLILFIGPIIIFGFTSKRNKTLFFMAAFIVVLFLYLITINRGGQEDMPYASQFLKSISFKSNFLYSVITYLTLPLAAFNEYIKEPFQWAFGQSTFRLIYKYFTMIDVNRIDGFILHTPLDTNVFSYLGNLYADFGFIGIVIFPLLLGCLFSVFYKKTINSESISSLCVFDSLFVMVAMSFFAWYISFIYVDIVLIFGILIYVLKKVLKLLTQSRKKGVVAL